MGLWIVAGEQAGGRGPASSRPWSYGGAPALESLGEEEQRGRMGRFRFLRGAPGLPACGGEKRAPMIEDSGSPCRSPKRRRVDDDHLGSLLRFGQILSAGKVRQSVVNSGWLV